MKMKTEYAVRGYEFEEGTKDRIDFVSDVFTVGFEMDRRFIDHHNDSCPHCRKPFDVKDGKLVNSGAVVPYMHTRTELKPYVVVPYLLCQECTKEAKSLTKGTDFESKVRDFMLERMPELVDVLK